MGTKVQCKTFFPICFSMREHNSETSSGWPLFYEDLPRSMQFRDSSTSRCIDGFLEYDKLVLKQTMLKHEAIFRTQVFELHRLYGRQIEMMDELKRQAQCSFALEARTSQSSATSPNLLQADSANVLERSSEISASITRLSIPAIGDSPCFFDGIGDTEFQISSVSKTTNALNNDGKLSQKTESASKMLIDLQLPADAYLETEDTGQGDIEIGRRASFLPRNTSAYNVDFQNELSCKIGCLGKGQIQTSDIGPLHCSNSLNIVDLNEPVEDSCCEEVCTSASSKLPRKGFLYAKNQDNQLETCSSSRNIDNDISHDLHYTSVFQDRGSVHKRLVPLLTKEGKGHVDSNRKSSIENIICGMLSDFCEPGKIIPTRSEDMFNRNHPELYKERTNSQNNFSERNQITGKVYSAAASAQTSGSLSFLAKLEHAPKTSDLNFPPEKPIKGIPTNDEELTSFRTCKTGSGSLDPSMWKFDYQGYQRLDDELIYHSNGCHDKLLSGSNLSFDVKLPKVSFDKSNLINTKSHSNLYDEPNTQKCFMRVSHCFDLKIAKEFNLNQSLPDDFSDAAPEQPGHKVAEVNKSSPEIPWLSGNGCTRESFDLNEAVETEIDPGSSSKANGTEVSLPQATHNSKALCPSIFMGPKQSRCQREMAENPGEKIFGISLVDITHDAVVGFHSGGFFSKIEILDLEKPVNEDQPINDDDISCNNIIDLNFVATSHLSSCTNTSDAEVQVLRKPSVSDVTGRSTGIDLELPAEALTELMFPEETHVSDPSVPKLTVNQKQDVNISEINSNTAAEIIISMSSQVSESVERSSRLPRSPDSADLFWFAGVITSQMGLFPDGDFSLSLCEGENCSSSGVDGMDFFEAMTLQLTETKVEDLLVRATDKEDHEETDGKFSSLLLPRPRRGQVRRRRQRRDFQKDVLPGLASLSRQEVTEDLQTIGGMMRASGQIWENITTRRNNGRGGRGRRQLNRRTTAPVMVEVPVELPQKEPSFMELEIEGMNMMGWGSTRRCRRSRCPPGNITAQAFT